MGYPREISTRKIPPITTKFVANPLTQLKAEVSLRDAPRRLLCSKTEDILFSLLASVKWLLLVGFIKRTVEMV
jgi:hypothetical protein